MNRREIIKGMAVLPFAGSLLQWDAAFGAPVGALDPLVIGPKIYESIGVDTIINCRGTFTIIGGSIERPEVLAAMEAASGNFVQYDELAFGIGRRFAEISGSEWGMVSAGCAAGLKHVTAACVAGGNPEKLLRIPDLSGLEKTEVIIPRYSRNAYDHGIRNIGVKIIEVETPEELQEALNTRTAMIYLLAGRSSEEGQPLSLEVNSKIAKPKNVPILMDAAAEDLTLPPIHLKRGATIVAYSGGKAICGPQCAGVLFGDKNILMSAWQASSPHHGPGRDNKVGKEEMLGMLAAVEAWVTRDHEQEWQTWLSWLDTISKSVTKIEGVTTTVNEPSGLGNRAPRLVISWNPDKLHVTGEEIAEEVGRSKPRIAIGSHTGDGVTSINVTPSQMQPGQEKVVADRLYEVLFKERSPISTEMASPANKINGHWEVDIDFFSSKSKHAFILEQDGNWLQGTHKADFSVQNIVGTIEGDQVKLRSDNNMTGDHITYIFSGITSGDSIKGSIYLGEYLNAKFTAKRIDYQPGREQIMIPGGPPLAT